MESFEDWRSGAYEDTPHNSRETFHENFLLEQQYRRDRIGRSKGAWDGYVWYRIICNNIDCDYSAWVRFDVMNVALEGVLSTVRK